MHTGRGDRALGTKSRESGLERGGRSQCQLTGRPTRSAPGCDSSVAEHRRGAGTPLLRAAVLSSFFQAGIGFQVHPAWSSARPDFAGACDYRASKG